MIKRLFAAARDPRTVTFLLERCIPFYWGFGAIVACLSGDKGVWLKLCVYIDLGYWQELI